MARLVTRSRVPLALTTTSTARLMVAPVLVTMVPLVLVPVLETTDRLVLALAMAPLAEAAMTLTAPLAEADTKSTMCYD